MPEPRAFEFELAIEQLKIHKSPGNDKTSTDLIKAGSIKIRYENHKRIIATWNKEELPDEWKVSIVVSIYKKGDKTYFSNYRGT